MAGGGGRTATPFYMLMSPKRRVREAHECVARLNPQVLYKKADVSK
jgi:hypothetical protein